MIINVYSVRGIVTFFLAAGSVNFSGAIPTMTHMPANVNLTFEGGDLIVFTRVMSAGFKAIS